jgi:hypothetical protein
VEQGPDMVRAGPWLELYQELSARPGHAVAAVEVARAHAGADLAAIGMQLRGRGPGRRPAPRPPHRPGPVVAGRRPPAYP